VASPLGNVVTGGCIALIVAGAVIVPAIAGIATWKWGLAAIGLWLFVRARREKG
jgi:hypothetical protein